MGYSERFCQLCGVGFNIGRIRRADEPIEAAWSGSGLGNEPVTSIVTDCSDEGCSNVTRTIDRHVYYDGSIMEAHEVEEHIAGENCESQNGYSGWRISAEEMQGCTRVQVVLYKDYTWKPEPADEDFVVNSPSCFLTGVSTGPPSEFEVLRMHPIRHGVDSCMISNGSDPHRGWGTPIHPSCMRMYERMSVERFGAVDLDGIRYLWAEEGDYDQRCENLSVSPDCDLVSEQFFECVRGTEYLAANPLHIPMLADLLQDCQKTERQSDSVFSSRSSNSSSGDPFSKLPHELKTMMLFQLNRRDVANLHYASRSFGELPQQYFQRIVKTDMPWVWETKQMIPANVDWHKLWCALSRADGGANEDEAHRQWLQDSNFALTRERYVLAGLSDDERYKYPILQSMGDKDSLTEEQEVAIAEIASQRKAEGKHRPKHTQIHGLRNRRRIYNDISKILDRLVMLRARDEDTEN